MPAGSVMGRNDSQIILQNLIVDYPDWYAVKVPSVSAQECADDAIMTRVAILAVNYTHAVLAT